MIKRKFSIRILYRSFSGIFYMASGKRQIRQINEKQKSTEVIRRFFVFGAAGTEFLENDGKQTIPR